MSRTEPPVSVGPDLIPQAPQPPAPKLQQAHILRLDFRMEIASPDRAQSN